MKRIKRIIAMVLVCVMVFSVTISASAADTDLQVIVESGEITAAGTLVVAVSLRNNPTIGAANLQIVFDRSNLKIEQITADYSDIDEDTVQYGGFFGSMVANPSEGIVTWANASGYKKNATLFWIAFSTTDNPVNGNYTVSIDMADGSSSMFSDDKGVKIDNVSVTPGTVSLSGGIDPVDLEPTIGSHPQSASYTYGQSASALTVEASVKAPENAVLTYQWYHNTENSNEGGTAIASATGKEYTPALNDFGTDYYYCVVTNTYQGKEYKAVSNAAAVEYTKAPIGSVVLNASEFTYTGSTITPVVTIAGLVEDTDYTLSGDTAKTVVGNYSITATGKGNYTGTVSADWSIVPADLTVSGTQSMTIYNNGKSYAIGEDVLKVATVDGTQAEVTYAVTEGDTVVKLEDGSLTALQTGSAVVTATAKAANHKDATVKIGVTVKNKESADDFMTFTAKKDTATYTGSPMALSDFVNAATCTLDGGTIRYQLNGSETTLDATVTNAGTYTVKAIYESETYYGEKTLTFTIEQAEIEVNAQWDYTAPFTYDGSEKTVELVSETVPAGVTVKYSGNSATDAGEYTATATFELVDSDNYTLSGSVDALNWKINQAEIKVSVSWNYTAPFTYDGDEKTVALTGVPDTVEVKYQGTKATDAGTYKATAELSAKDSNYVVNDTVAPLTWEIKQAEVTVPTAAENLIFDGTEKIGVAETDKYSVVNGKATHAGNYTATVTLNDSKNYVWATEFDGNVSWSIAKAAGQTLTENVDVLYSDNTTRTIDSASILAKLAKAGDVTITNAEKTDADEILSDVTLEAGVVSYALTAGLKGSDENKSATITVTFTSTNYETSTLTVTVKVINKENVSEQIQFEGDTGIYNGQEQSHETATFNGSSDNITYSYEGDRVNVGTFSVTATYEDATRRGTKTVSFEITPKTLNASGATVQTKEYDGTTVATVKDVQFAGLVEGDTLTSDDYQVSEAAFDTAAVGTNKTVTYKVTLNTERVKNYTLSSNEASTSGTISKKEITVTLDSISAQTFNGGALRPTVTVNATGLVSGESLTEGTDYTVSYDNNTNAGTATVTVSSMEGSNYVFTAVDGTFQINKAAALTLSDIALSYVYAESGNKSVTLPMVPENAGEVSYQVKSVSGTDISSYQIVDGQLNFVLVAEDSTAVGAKTTAVVEITMANYETSTVNVVITRTDKEAITASADSIVMTYTGVALTDADLSGTASVEGKWVWVTDPADLVNANELGYTATVKFVPNDSVHYAEKEVEISVIVLKANPTGEPAYTKITESGKTLADAALNVGSIQPDGTIAWELGETTEVESGVAYKWIFTPTDTVNYNTLEGTVVLYEEVYVPPYVPEKPSDSSETEPETNFRDVQPGDWYAEAVEMVVREGLFTGVSSTRFDPEGAMTRAMLVTVLWRLDGEPAAKGATGFQDVVKGSWYAEAVAWANENGIVNGYNETTFGTNDFITREQMAAILYRYASYAGVDVSARADLSGYADLSELDAYAEAPMAWAVAEGLITGLSASRLSPDGNATRAQVATILMRFVENIRK